MMTVLLVVHLMIAASLVGVVLLQRSEGGALGIGGGGGGFLTGRGQANLLTRVTAALALAFFITSILLTILAKQTAPAGSAFDKSTAPASSTTAPASGTPATSDTPASSTAPAEPGAAAPGTEAPKGGILDKLR